MSVRFVAAGDGRRWPGAHTGVDRRGGRLGPAPLPEIRLPGAHLLGLGPAGAAQTAAGRHNDRPRQ